MEREKRSFAEGPAWAVILVVGIVVLFLGLAGQPDIGDLSILTVCVGIGMVLGDAVWVARSR
jgi:hypothetical protein